MRLLLVITFAALATAAPAAEQIPEPEELTINLYEDNFEDYLDPWLEKEYLKRNHTGSAAAQSGITF